jgi:hypothetical protein
MIKRGYDLFSSNSPYEKGAFFIWKSSPRDSSGDVFAKCKIYQDFLLAK